MEDQTIGKKCDFEYCQQLDYLSFFCNLCNKNFCKIHAHIAVNCPNYHDSKGNLKTEIKTNQEFIICYLCKVSIPKFSSSNCNDCKRDFCLKHRLTFDHNCSKTYRITKPNNLTNNSCSICKDNKGEVKACNSCRNILCLKHMPYLNHNCNHNKKVNMNESFQENKNKILNDLKAKKQLKSKISSACSNKEQIHKDYDVIKSQALGNNLVVENDRFFLRIVQNCQLNFEEIKGFPIYRFYNKDSFIKDVISSLLSELELKGNYLLCEKTDIYMKNPFNHENKLSEIKSIINGDTIMISKIQDG